MKSLIKSKARIADHGEVFTPPEIVCAMIELAQETIIQPNKDFSFNTVLDPACGDGNFLAEILQQRLANNKNNLNEKIIFLALSTIYGIELLGDNVRDCRNRLLEIVKTYNSNNDFLKSIEFLLKKNIIQGNTLEMIETTWQGKTVFNTNNKKIPIIFSSWEVLENNLIQRNLEVFFQMGEDFNSQLKTEPYRFSPFSFLDLQNLDFQNQMNKEEGKYSLKMARKFESYIKSPKPINPKTKAINSSQVNDLFAYARSKE